MRWEAQTVLRDVEEVYRSCRTYRDGGLVETAMRWGFGGQAVLRTVFSSRFQRPGCIRFDYAREGGSTVAGDVTKHTVCVDCNTLLIRRVQSRRSLVAISSADTASYASVFDAPVGADELRFAPPCA